MLLLTHLIIKRSSVFCILTYLKSWNYNTNALVRIIVSRLNRCELLQNLKFYTTRGNVTLVILAFFVTEA